MTPLFRINDLRVRYTTTPAQPTPLPRRSRVYVLVDGLNVSDAMTTTVTHERAALMLAAFNSGRECHWVDLGSGRKALTTLPAGWMGNHYQSPRDYGMITHWDVCVPVTGDIEFSLELAADPDLTPTTGNPSAAWAKINASERDALVIFSLLSSRFRYYAKGDVINSFYVDSLAESGEVIPVGPKPAPFLRTARTQVEVW